jgi:soluble lytic murein transglycosylase-like protein
MMIRVRTVRKRLALLLLAAAVLAAGAWGTYSFVRWRHDEGIEARLDRLAPIIWRHAQANSLPTGLVRDVIRAESGADERAVSARNAKGLMQITPIAMEEVCRVRGIERGGDLFDPDYNVQLGTAYLRILLDKFDGDAHLALAAYHMGPTKLLQARRADPALTGREIVEKVAPPTTIRYCRTVLRGRDLRLPNAPRTP